MGLGFSAFGVTDDVFELHCKIRVFAPPYAGGGWARLWNGREMPNRSSTGRLSLLAQIGYRERLRCRPAGPRRTVSMLPSAVSTRFEAHRSTKDDAEQWIEFKVGMKVDLSRPIIVS